MQIWANEQKQQNYLILQWYVNICRISGSPKFLSHLQTEIMADWMRFVQF